MPLITEYEDPTRYDSPPDEESHIQMDTTDYDYWADVDAPYPKGTWEKVEDAGNIHNVILYTRKKHA